MSTIKLNEPKTKIAKVLYLLTMGKSISGQDLRINSFSSIISDLRNDYKVPIRHVKEVSQDEFGKKNRYYRYFTLSIDRKKCQRVYQRINQ